MIRYSWWRDPENPTSTLDPSVKIRSSAITSAPWDRLVVAVSITISRRPTPNNCRKCLVPSVSAPILLPRRHPLRTRPTPKIPINFKTITTMTPTRRKPLTISVARDNIPTSKSLLPTRNKLMPTKEMPLSKIPMERIWSWTTMAWPLPRAMTRPWGPYVRNKNHWQMSWALPNRGRKATCKKCCSEPFLFGASSFS